jgi:hypothetical protein
VNNPVYFQIMLHCQGLRQIQKSWIQLLLITDHLTQLRVEVRTVNSWVEGDLIPYHKPGRITIFDLNEIIEWLEKKRGRSQVAGFAHLSLFGKISALFRGGCKPGKGQPASKKDRK